MGLTIIRLWLFAPISSMPEIGTWQSLNLAKFRNCLTGMKALGPLKNYVVADRLILRYPIVYPHRKLATSLSRFG